MQVDIGSRLIRDAKRSTWKDKRWSPIISSCVEIMAMKEAEKTAMIKKKTNETKEKKEWALEVKRTRIHSQNTHDELPRWFK